MEGPQATDLGPSHRAGEPAPQTDDAEKDLEIFEKLMAFDEGGLARREPKIRPAEIARRIELINPWNYFTASFKGNAEDMEAVAGYFR